VKISQVKICRFADDAVNQYDAKLRARVDDENVIRHPNGKNLQSPAAACLQRSLPEQQR